MDVSGNACPCGRGDAYERCCGPVHDGAPAPTAERLMRSRYSAFALGREEYLRASWHPSRRPSVAETLLDPETRWLRLAVEQVEDGGPFDSQGYVTFTAVGQTPEGRIRQRERSRFVREGGADTAARRWYYIDGESLEG